MKGFLIEVGCMLVAAVLAMLFANAYGYLVPENWVPYSLAMLVLFLAGIALTLAGAENK